MDRDGLPRNCHLSRYFLGSAILFVYFNYADCELRLRRTASCGRRAAVSGEDPENFRMGSLGS